MKNVVFCVLMLSSFSIYGQNNLDVAKYESCELFSNKKDFDIKARIEKIKELEGIEVVFFVVKGKGNKIKSSFTGIMSNGHNSKLDEKTQANVITVIKNKGQKGMIAKFPMTNNKSYRIYLNDCFKKQK